MPQPFAVVSVAEMRALEAAAMEAGTPERVLQERAGLAVADAVEAEAATTSRNGDGQRGVVVLVGSGNNGRDAVVTGRRLAARGWDVTLWWGARCPLSNYERIDIAAEGIRTHRFDDDGFAWRLEAQVEAADFVIDGLLGVGSRGPMRPELARVASVVNNARGRARAGVSRRQVVAVDVPSGIDADDGAVPGVVVNADITVTFGAVKAGLLRFPAARHAGRIVPAWIGIPAAQASAYPVHVLQPENVRYLLPERAPDAHKYRVGRALVVAGSNQYVGAACLGSEAAARAGAGLVGLVSTEAVKRVLATRLPEATYPLTVATWDDSPERGAADVAALLPDQSALLIGPGIGRTAGTGLFLQRLLAARAELVTPTPTVIDADALSLLAEWPQWWGQIGRDTVLTPHAGEMARLLASDADGFDGAARDVAPSWEIARRAAQRWGQVVVLKGPFTTVAQPDGRAWIYPHANPALATAGTGDVLAGLTAGLLAQGLSASAAARLAVVTHALAARRAQARNRGATLLASDLPDEIPVTLRALSES